MSHIVGKTLTVADSAFRSLKQGYTGFHVWRVEKMSLTAVPREGMGKFFTGDCYVIFSATENGQPGGPDTRETKARGGRVEQHIHFWVGDEASQDEAGVAAYKTVELDDFLDGAPIQHREVQGHESKRFLSYFKDGIRILQGGVASGLNHVTNDLTPKLYLVKGKRQPIVRQTRSISWDEINEGDVYVLDVRTHFFVWTGKHSNRLEKLQGSKLAQKLKDEDGVGEIVIVNDGEEGRLPEEELEIFNQHLPIASKEIKAASEFESDEKEDVRTRGEIRLYKCSDEEGTLRISEVKTGPLLQADLMSADSFIVDNGNSGIWVWVGKKASQKERTEAMRNAQGFIKKKGYNSYTSVTRVVDGGEPSEFKSLFKGWKEKDQTIGFGKTYTTGRGVANVVQTKFDAKTLHEQPSVAASTRMVDDGKGAKEVFRVDNFDLLQVDEEDEGKFYSGDCYVVLYAYNNGNKDSYMIYYWLGAHSAQDEQGTAALKAVELDQRLGGSPVQVRVVQGKEPPHFLAMFQGRLTIFQGGLASDFDGEGKRDVSVGSTYLLQVHGRTQLATRAVQVDLEAASLNTNDCFVLVSPRETFVWLGKGSTGDERETAKAMAATTNQDPEIVYEGQEKPAFWALLGGKGDYMDQRILKEEGEERDPRLFHGSNASGNFKLEEVLNFSQADLVSEDVMLLDIGDSVFVWLGCNSNRYEKNACIESAREYLRTDPSGRDENSPILVVKQGFEPPHFTGMFGFWDEDLFDDDESYAQQMIGSTDPEVATANGYSSEPGKYGMEILLRSDELPGDVDPSRKETYLSDALFEEVFGMDKDAFEALAQWRRTALKKKVGLF